MVHTKAVCIDAVRNPGPWDWVPQSGEVPEEAAEHALLCDARSVADSQIRDELSSCENPVPAALIDAMQQAILAAGKRRRPLLRIAVVKSMRGDAGNALRVAAVEMVRAASLAIDDLPRPSREPRWGQLMDRQADHGLCDSHKREALLIWPGDAPEFAPHDNWPQSLSWSDRLLLGRAISNFYRYGSHLKITYQPDRPHKAKAHLGFCHQWLPMQPSSADSSEMVYAS